MKQVLIDRISVTIDPKVYVGNGTTPLLEIEVRTMGQTHHLREALRESDIESRFDMIFESAKRELLAAMKKQAAEASRTESEVVV